MNSKGAAKRTWRRAVLGAAVCLLWTSFLPGVSGGEDGRWVWGRNNRNQKYVAGGIDDGLVSPGAGGVLGGDGVNFGIRPSGYRPGGVGGYRPGYFRPEPPPVHEGPAFGGVPPPRPPILAGPGGPTFGGPGFAGPGGGGPGFGGPGIGGPGIGGPGIGGPGIGGPGIGGPGLGGPGLGGPGIGGPGIGPGIGGPGIGGPGIGGPGIGGPGIGGPGIGGPGVGGPGGGFGGPGGRPGILTGPIPSWEQERLDALGVGHRYHSFETCKCVHSFNCKSPGLTFGKCDKDKQYCCNGIQSGTVGHGVRRPHFGEGYPPPPPLLPPPGPGFGPGPIGDPGYGPHPGDLGFDRSAKQKKA